MAVQAEYDLICDDGGHEEHRSYFGDRNELHVGDVWGKCKKCGSRMRIYKLTEVLIL